jgi:hypothetical protein
MVESGHSLRRRKTGMTLIRVLALAGMVALLGRDGALLQTQEQPSIAFGMAKVSLGMTVQQVEQHLSEAGRYIEFLPDKKQPSFM